MLTGTTVRPIQTLSLKANPLGFHTVLGSVYVQFRTGTARARAWAGPGRRPLGIWYLSWIYLGYIFGICLFPISRFQACVSLERRSPMQSYCSPLVRHDKNIVRCCKIHSGIWSSRVR